MNILLFGLAAYFYVGGAIASDNCAASVAKGLETRDVAKLSSLFASSDRTTETELAHLLGQTGQITGLTDSVTRRPQRFKRLSVYAAGSSRSFSSEAFELQGTTARLGEVRIQVHLVPGARCSLLALFVDSSL